MCSSDRTSFSGSFGTSRVPIIAVAATLFVSACAEHKQMGATDAWVTISVSGVVLDDETGKPLAGAEVFAALDENFPSLNRPHTSSSSVGSTAGDGSFRCAFSASYGLENVQGAEKKVAVVVFIRKESYNLHRWFDVQQGTVGTSFNLGPIRLKRQAGGVPTLVTPGGH